MIADVMKDDWEVNMGFGGWLGDDYRIMNINADGATVTPEKCRAFGRDIVRALVETIRR